MRQYYKLLARASREIDRTGNGIDEGQDAAKGRFAKGDKVALVVDRFDGAVGTHQDSELNSLFCASKRGTPVISHPSKGASQAAVCRISSSRSRPARMFPARSQAAARVFAARQDLQPFKMRGPEDRSHFHVAAQQAAPDEPP